MIQNFEFYETKISGLVEILPFNANDIRGSFTKDFSTEIFEINGINHDLKEIFYTTSRKGVLRGLHFQRVKQQPKLVRCISGHVWDVVVDLRKGSSTFKQWISFDLTGENRREVLIPGGCAHGFLALEESIVSYKCAEKFFSEYDDGILWNDPDLAIKWPLARIGGGDMIILSNKDKSLQTFRCFMEM